MLDLKIKKSVLFDIPEIGIIDTFTDEILQKNIIKEDILYKQIEIALNYTTGLKLVGATRWEDVELNKDLQYISKLLINAEDIKDIKKSFKTSNGMQFQITLKFYDEKTVYENISSINRFVLNYIEVVGISDKGTEKLFNKSDLSLMKDNIRDIKEKFEQTLEMLANEINAYAGSAKIAEVIRVNT